LKEAAQMDPYFGKRRGGGGRCGGEGNEMEVWAINLQKDLRQWEALDETDGAKYINCIGQPDEPN
jgi:hypothetical protein